jgi:glycosyltransferase involved in cell wall biosynthesis
MRILIDLQGAQTSSRFRGIGRYSLELTKGLLRNAHGHQILVLLNGLLPDSIEGIRQELKGLISTDQIFVWEGVGPTAYVDVNNRWRQHASEIIREHFVQSINPDLLLNTSLFEGYGDDYAGGISDLDPDIPVVTIFYDLIPLIYPEDYLSDSLYAQWYKDRLSILKKVDFFLSISNSSMAEAIRYLEIPSDRITNISSAVSEKFAHKQDELMASEFLRSIGIKKPFLMYTSATDARKNHLRLIEAYANLDNNLKNKHQLVFAGGMPKEHQNRFKKYAKNLGLDIKSLIFTGELSDDELNILYSSCLLFVFPSWHEGFGLPILEAMHFNKAVIASNQSSIPEILQNDAALFDPFDVNDIRQKMHKALTDIDFRKSLESKSEDRKKFFSWDTTAKLAINAMEVFFLQGSIKNKCNSIDDSKKNQDIVKLISRIRNINLPHKNIDLLRAAESISLNSYKSSPKQLLVDISVLVEHDAKTGIQRVVRNILREWLSNPPKGFKVEPVYAEIDKPYSYARKYTESLLGQAIGPNRDDVVEFSSGDIFIGLDLLYPFLAEKHYSFYRKMKNHGVLVKYLVYDLLPILLPSYVVQGAPEAHERWLKIVSQSDGAICISQSVALELKEWLDKERIPTSSSFEIDWFHLGADEEVPITPLLEDLRTEVEAIKFFSESPSFLSVGTIEPRKGHAQILSAFELLWAQGYDINLVLVGKQGWKVDQLIEKIRNHPELGSHLFWFSGVSDPFLSEIYKHCACLIAASEGEGFGLPLIEAAHKGIPIIARSIPVFREVAGDHAYYFEGLTPNDLALAIQHWLKLIAKNNAPSSKEIPWITWVESARQLLRALNKGLIL